MLCAYLERGHSIGGESNVICSFCTQGVRIFSCCFLWGRCGHGFKQLFWEYHRLWLAIHVSVSAWLCACTSRPHTHIHIVYTHTHTHARARARARSSSSVTRPCPEPRLPWERNQALHRYHSQIINANSTEPTARGSVSGNGNAVADT